MNWTAALRLGRVSNLATIWTNVLAGFVLAGVSWNAKALAVVIVAMSLFYTGGMFLNDALDQKFDREHRPERPIPSGEADPRAVLAITAGLFSGGMILLVMQSRTANAGWSGLAAGAALIGAIVAYNLRHKDNPFGPLVMSVCRVLVYIGAAVALGSLPSQRILMGAGAAGLYVLGLTYCAKREHEKRRVNSWALACCAAPLLYLLIMAHVGTAASSVLLVLMAVVLRAFYGPFSQAKQTAAPDIGSLIAGISLVDALLIACAGDQALAAVAAAAFPLSLIAQRHIAGT